MSRARDTEFLAVHKGEERAATLSRTTGGASLAYIDEHLARGGPGLASTLPLGTAGIEVHGVNLHPFFAGLLPEGLRLRALQRAAKTSEDDLFTLLAAMGDDVVGDVWCAPLEAERAPPEALVDARRPSGLVFAELFERALAGVDRATFAGVQPKVSAGRLTLPLASGGRGATQILKLPSEEFPRLVENESFVMELARAAGLDVARTRIVTDRIGATALLVERFDRTRNEDGSLARHAVEDLCQLMGRYPADKYRLALADAMRTLEVATAPTVERLRLLQLHAFCYISANGDLHGKNVSVVERGGTTRLSPAYDLVSTLPYGDEHMALKLDGKDARMKRSDFVLFGARHGVREEATERMLDQLVRGVRRGLGKLGGLAMIGFDDRTTRRLETEFAMRLGRLESAD